MCDFGPELDLVAELIACDSTATIDAGEGYAAYAWSTGDSTQTTEVAQSGTYEVEFGKLADSRCILTVKMITSPAHL